MISKPALILLDTNIPIHCGQEIGQQIEADHQLRRRQLKPLISFAMVGEIQALTLKRGWDEKRKKKLNELLHELVIVDHIKPNMIKDYARINHFSEQIIKPARPIGQNDIWIAATAQCLASTTYATLPLS